MKVSTKVKAFYRLSDYIDDNQPNILFNAVIMSNFYYCLLIWLFCSKAANNNMSRVHKRALKVMYQDFESTFEELLSRHEDVTIYVKKPTETAIRSLQNAAPPKPRISLGEFPNEIYNLRKQVLCGLPQRSHTIKYGINSLRFKRSCAVEYTK